MQPPVWKSRSWRSRNPLRDEFPAEHVGDPCPASANRTIVTSQPRSLDRFLPEYRHNEIHETVIAASPEAVRRAVWAVKGSEIALARLLFGIRALPGRLLGRRLPERDYERTVLDAALAGGFIRLSENA